MTQYSASYDSRLIKNMEYDANGNLEYFGMAKSGTSDDDPGWFIMKMTYHTAEPNAKMATVRFAENGSLSQTWTGYANHNYS